MTGHFLVCGIGHFGYRMADLLLRLGEGVAVVTKDSREEWLAELAGRGALVVRGDARQPEHLKAAGIASADALLVATEKDLTNIEVALDARRLRPDLHLVVRLFDQQLGRRLESTFGIRVFGMSALAAPAFAAAAIGEHRIASFVLEGAALGIGRLEVRGDSPLRGLTVAEAQERHRAMVLGISELNDGLPSPAARLEEGTGITLLAGRDDWLGLLPPAARSTRSGPGSARRRSQRWRASFRSAWQGAPAPLRTVFIVLCALIALSVFVFRFGLDLSFVDALYFLVTTVTTVGYGDFNLRESGPALKLYGALVMLLGSATIATLYSLLTDFVVGSRFQQLSGRRRLPAEDPIVVVGIGNVGFRVLEELRGAGVQAVAVERDPGGPFVPAASAHVPVIRGDGRLPEILERAGAGRAHAVVAVTGDDAANLGIALAARELNPQLRTVARLFDPDLAGKVEESLGLSAVLSASRTATPTFVAAALLPEVLSAFVREERFFALAPLRVPPELAGKRPSELDPAGRLQCVARRSEPEGPYLLPPDDRPLLLGEQIVALTRRPLRQG